MAGARIEEILSEEILKDTGEHSPVLPVVNNDPPQVDTGPPEWDGEERAAIADWASQSSQYHWDDIEDQRSSVYRSNAVTHVTESYMERRQYYTTVPKVIFRASAGAIDKTVEPVYDHRARRRTDGTRPKRPRDEHQTISGYWEINGTRAHCLLDSGCEGVMISPDFARATGVKTFELERPIGLQLACIGSKSIINYGANATIVFGNQSINEYFDVANIDYYDAILGTPFLRRMKLSLDFNGPGQIHMGTIIIPNGANQLRLEDTHPRTVVRTTVPNSN